MAGLLGHREYNGDLVQNAYEAANLAIPTWAVSLPLQLLLGGVLVSFALRSLRPRLNYRSLALHLGAGLLVLLVFQALHSMVIGLGTRPSDFGFIYRRYLPSEAALNLLAAVSAATLAFALGWARSPRGLPGAPMASRSLAIPLLGAAVSAAILLLGFVAGAFPHLGYHPVAIGAGVVGVFSIVLFADAVAIWSFAPYMPARRIMLPLTVVSVIFIPLFLAMLVQDGTPTALLPLGPNLVTPTMSSSGNGLPYDMVFVVVAQFVGYAAFNLVTRRISQRATRNAF